MRKRIKKPYIAAVFLAFFVLFSVSAHASWNITECSPCDAGADGCLNESGTYYLLNDCTGQLTIETNDIVIDCQGHSIVGTSPIAINIFSGPGRSNLTIQNCVFQNPTFSNGGLYLDSLNSSTIKNNTFLNYSFHPTNGYGDIEFDLNYGNVSDNYIYNNTFYNDSISMYSESSGYYAINNHIYNNTFYSPPQLNTVYGNDILFNNWNETVGNWWYGFSDNASACGTCNDGICTNPYVFDENNTDYRPLCTAAEEPCVPSWNCTAWGECVRGYQTRVCTDDNSCQNETGKPAESQPCLKALPNATFNVSGDCCPISTFYCTDNETLVQLWNTSDGVSWAVETCEFGCDNVTDSCTPLPYAQNLWLLVIFAGIVVVGLAFIRWVR